MTNRKRNRYDFFELLIIPYSAIYIIDLIRTGFEFSLDSLFLISILFWIIYYLIIRRRLSTKDTQIRVFIHLVLVLSATYLSSRVFFIFNYWLQDIPIPQLSFIPPLTMYVLITIGSIGNMLQISPVYRDSFDEISTRAEYGDFSSRIEDGNLLNDTVFSSIAELVNNLMSLSGDLIWNMRSSVENIVDTSEELSAISEEVNASSEQISATSSSMAQGASSQSEMVQNLVVKITEVSSVIEDIVTQVRNNVGHVQQISLQTNILALNAGIEASRAGDYGRGFAVVAENVRKLSEESKNSAEEISEVVELIANTLGTLFDDIQNGIANVAAIAEETAASAEEIAAGSQEVTASMQEMSLKSEELVQVSNLSQQVVTKYIGS